MGGTYRLYLPYPRLWAAIAFHPASPCLPSPACVVWPCVCCYGICRDAGTVLQGTRLLRQVFFLLSCTLSEDPYLSTQYDRRPPAIKRNNQNSTTIMCYCDSFGGGDSTGVGVCKRQPGDGICNFGWLNDVYTKKRSRRRGLDSTPLITTLCIQPATASLHPCNQEALQHGDGMARRLQTAGRMATRRMSGVWNFATVASQSLYMPLLTARSSRSVFDT